MLLPKALRRRRARGARGSMDITNAEGHVTLETLGLVPNPLTRRLVRMRLLLSSVQGGADPVSRLRA